MNIDQTAYRTLKWSARDGIGTLSPDQQPANTMSIRFFRELLLLCREELSSSELKAIIISGSGRHFSSGADLDELRENIRNETFLKPKGNEFRVPDSMQSNLETLQYFDHLQIPVITAIRGVCIGSGLEMALHSHFRLATPNAVLGLPESTYNLIPGLGGVQHLRKLISKTDALEILLKGNTFNASEGLTKGIIDRIVPRNSLMKAATLLANIASTNYRKYLKPDYLKEFDKHFKEI
jgi:enoyl-CoA hydratase/carnithine racemase